MLWHLGPYTVDLLGQLTLIEFAEVRLRHKIGLEVDKNYYAVHEQERSDRQNRLPLINRPYHFFLHL